MNRRLFLHLWHRNWTKVAAVCGGLALWGVLTPVIDKAILGSLRSLPQGLKQFGSGNLTSFPGVITVMFEHPLVVAMACTIVVGVAVPAIAGQRQSGILEMVLARPIGRPTVVLTTALAVLSMLVVGMIAMVLGIAVGSAAEGLGAQLSWRDMAVVLLNAVLLYSAFGAFALAASAISNRNGPAVACTLAYLLVNYFLEILGGFWGVAKAWQPYSLFHHFSALQILTGNASMFDLGLLLVAACVPLAVAVSAFSRRDLPAPG